MPIDWRDEKKYEEASKLRTEISGEFGIDVCDFRLVELATLALKLNKFVALEVTAEELKVIDNYYDGKEEDSD